MALGWLLAVASLLCQNKTNSLLESRQPGCLRSVGITSEGISKVDYSWQLQRQNSKIFTQGPPYLILSGK